MTGGPDARPASHRSAVGLSLAALAALAGFTASELLHGRSEAAILREVQRLAALYTAAGRGPLRAFHDELLAWGSASPAVIAWGMGLAPAPPAAAVA